MARDAYVQLIWSYLNDNEMKVLSSAMEHRDSTSCEASLPRVVALAAVLASAIAAPVVGQPQPAKLSPLNARQAAGTAVGFRVVVSLEHRRLWVVDDEGDTLLATRAAVGSGKTLRSAGRTWTFRTPRGIYTVVSKEEMPIWIPPDWYYVEIARQRGLALATIAPDRGTPISKGRVVAMRNGAAGVIEADDTFHQLPLGALVVFDRTLFIPPIGSENRRIAGTLGHFRLVIGDGFGIHGTDEPMSVGRAVTHGCLRLNDADIAWLYEHVPVGTRVFIY